ncbi:poly (ADP ribose) polymerase 1 [Echinococcus multilocularis]|uniref:Poly (ADP ribose) polymerase 1 n=1 Tax=Echinococcus multilocularis TaxID=6211 RepID=A0A0S4MKW7_ECHMU|nr:poly (ADP ribose) polymerase 1 [Echinococcus multilocularis]
MLRHIFSHELEEFATKMDSIMPPPYCRFNVPASKKLIEKLARHLIGDAARFYALISHGFGLKVPLLSDSDPLKLEVPYFLTKTGGSDVKPLDEHSKKLKNRIEVSTPWRW